jgi:hypothetical protein
VERLACKKKNEKCLLEKITGTDEQEDLVTGGKTKLNL